jgi:hypothetical protein
MKEQAKKQPLTTTFLGGYLTFFKKKFDNHDCISEPM